MSDNLWVIDMEASYSLANEPHAFLIPARRKSVPRSRKQHKYKGS